MKFILFNNVKIFIDLIKSIKINKTLKSMDQIEVMIINILDKYKIKANRDRFILPLEKEIC